MAAATDYVLTESAGLVPAKGTYGAAANVLLYGGTIVTIDANGHADVVTAGQHSPGVAVADCDNRTTAPEGGGAAAVNCEVAFGVHGLAYTGTAPKPGQVVYVVDNQTVSIDSSSGSRGVAGYCVELREGKCWTYMSPAIAGEISKLLSSATGQGASLVSIEDAASNFAAVTVEAALAEIIADYAAVTNGNGASKIGLEDSGTLYTAANVEAALAEVKPLADSAYAGRIQHRQLVVTESDLTAAAATETLNIGAVLPANATILGVTMHTYTPFTGGTISDFTVDIGSSGDADALVDGANLFASAVDGAPATMTAGVNPRKTFVAAGAQLTAKFDCGSDDVADATAGAVTIDVMFTVLQ